MKYLAAENVEWNTACADSAMTLTEAVEALNAAYTDVFGGFLPNSGNDGIVLAAPKLAGAVEAPNGTSGYSGAIAGAEGAVTYTNNYSVATSLNLFGHNDGGNLKYKTGNVKIDANTDLAAAVAVLNTGLETLAYRLNDGQIEALYSLNSASVTNYGVQETKAENGAFAVRFIGLLNSKSFTEAGFTVSATIKQEGKADVVVTDKDCKVTSAFDSLLEGNEDITIGTETVKSPLGTDFFAYTITGVPANATVTFTFTPYATASTTVTGATYTVTYVNGVLA